MVIAVNPQTLYCRSIVDATYQSVKLIMHRGKFKKDERGDTIKYYKHIIIVIPIDCCENSNDELTRLCDDAFAYNLKTGKPSGNGVQAHEYTYGEELHAPWENQYDDELEKVIEDLIAHPETRRAVYLYKPKHLYQKERPCMVQVCFDIETDSDDEYLNLTIFGRSNEMVIAMKSDLKGFAELGKYVAKRVSVKPGTIVLHDVNAHCRIKSDMGVIKKVLKNAGKASNQR